MEGVNILVDVGMSYLDGFNTEINTEMRQELRNILIKFITKQCTLDQAKSSFIERIGRDEAVLRVGEILDCPDEPLPSHDDETDDPQSRRKTRSWTSAEDTRLIAGVAKFGTDNWQAVAHFLGSGRNRAQCSQRWIRCLDPRISRKPWTEDEDIRLETLVKTIGDKAWTKVAALLGNRSDVQCRYHYKQIIMAKNLPFEKQMSTEQFHTPKLPTPQIGAGPSPPITLISSRGFQSTPIFQTRPATMQPPVLLPMPTISPGRIAFENSPLPIDNFLNHFV